MNTFLACLFVVICVGSSFGQATSSVAEIVTVYSQNEKYYLKSIPYDNEFPSLRGKSAVYEKGKTLPLYAFERGFDSVDEESNNLILSNSGEVIFFIIPWEANEEKEGLKSVSVYRKGELIKSYTESEITGCDLKKERCDLVYDNYKAVVAEVGSRWGTENYKKTFKNGVDEKEKFLSDFAIFSFDDTVYLTDSKKKVHLFDLKDGSYIRSDAFESIYDQIKTKGRFTKSVIQSYDVPTFLDFPKLKNGKATQESLAAFLGMKTVDIYSEKDKAFKWYSFEINGNISRDGGFEIEKIDVGDELSKAKIVEFFSTNKFDSSAVPQVFAKWNIGDDIFFLRKKDDKLAKEEKQRELIHNREELKKRLSAETIDGRHIPKDLGEAFAELDKSLPEIDRKEMLGLQKRAEMIQYHMGLGMWMRNNWGLWGGSRLQKYFTDKGITHPDDMSSVILFFYWDWLQGRKDAWREWEKDPKQKIF